MSDDEILVLERRIATGDLAAWPLLDAALARAGRPPRRVWYVWAITGEYSDRSEFILDDKVHATKDGARNHLVDEANRRGIPITASDDERADGTPTKEPEEGKHFTSQDTTLFLSWSEVRVALSVTP